MTSSRKIKLKIIYSATTTTINTTINNTSVNKSKIYDKMKRDRDPNKTSTTGLPGAVSHFYYKHGLFLSSYPTCATSIAIVAILFACYPLINIPLPGTIPTKIVLPFEGSYTLFNAQNLTSSAMRKNPFQLQQQQQDDTKSDNKIKFLQDPMTSASSSSPLGFNNLITTDTSINEGPAFTWAQKSPMLYVQQITLRAGVLPWSSKLQLMDAFRAPLYEVFKLLEIVRNHEIKENGRTLDDICLRVDSVKRVQNEKIFPEYDCLTLSPANLWSQNIEDFANDANILNTIFQYHNLQKTKVSVAEMLFGLPMQDTGIKRYPIRTRSRIIQYAITLILKQNDPEYLHSLKEKLLKYYSMPNISTQNKNENNNNNHQQQQDSAQNNSEKSSITYIFYPGEFRLVEFLPLFIAFLVLLTYIYFSVRKIDIIHSRVLLAFSAMITVLGSLVMSLGICFFFGLTISLQSKDIFPYLVILLGLENCLVITKSVVSTSETFDNKIRVAQALSKEGWNISKTLLTEITILTIGLATFVPVIQEFCVFAIVALLSDFLLQMLFFSTILAMNIKRPEYTVEARHLPKMMFTANGSVNNALLPQGRHDFRFFAHTSNGVTFQRSQSHPKLALGDFALADMHKLNNNNNLNCNNNNNNTNNNNNNNNNTNEKRIPKRLRIVNFWARTRFFQRAFMLWMIVWIFSIVYNSGCLEHLFAVSNGRATSSLAADKLQRNIAQFFAHIQATRPTNAKQQNNMEAKITSTASAGTLSDNETLSAQMRRLQYPEYELNYFLSNFHWSTIMKQYNISLSGRYVTILPSIKLSMAISPETAAAVRNPHEKMEQNYQWKALAAALDPLDFNDDESYEFPLTLAEAAVGRAGGTPLFPKSPMEIFFAIMLACISISVLCYTMVVFYRCICTRNYAEWRSSWYESYEGLPTTNEQILEGVPTRIAGHKHRIECLVSDGVHIISCCLQGQIKMWDVRSGEEVSKIDRHDMQLAAQNGEQHMLQIRHYARSPVWCIDYFDDLIAAGCANGRIELWEASTGNLKCAYQEEGKRNLGITHIYLNGDRIIVARLCGRLDFYRLETYCKGKQIDWCFTSAYRRTHVRTGSTGSIGIMQQQQRQQQLQHGSYGANNTLPTTTTTTTTPTCTTTREEMKCVLTSIRLAHQQPITCMEVANGMVFTGSQDHTLKVYSLSDNDMEYTLHSHCGPITCLFVDRWQPGTGGSGSRDGLLCVWDLFTGACMYTIQAHDGAISYLACAPSYVISLGTDERICVWERFQGNLLTTINVSNAYSSLLMLTPSLLVTSKPGSLIVWDVRTGEPAREVKLDRSNTQFCPKYMMLTHDSVICDYGNELRAVRFPIVAMDKCN